MFEAGKKLEKIILTLLPLPNCHSQRLPSQTLCRFLRTFSTTYNRCIFWAQQFSANQHPHVLQLERQIHVKGVADLPITLASAMNPLPRCRPTPL